MLRLRGNPGTTIGECLASMVARLTHASEHLELPLSLRLSTRVIAPRSLSRRGQPVGPHSLPPVT